MVLVYLFLQFLKEYLQTNRNKGVEIDKLAKFRKWNSIKIFNVGDKVFKDGILGVIQSVIFLRCYSVLWENGQQNHSYYSELDRVQ